MDVAACYQNTNIKSQPWWQCNRWSPSGGPEDKSLHLLCMLCGCACCQLHTGLADMEEPSGMAAWRGTPGRESGEGPPSTLAPLGFLETASSLVLKGHSSFISQMSPKPSATDTTPPPITHGVALSPPWERGGSAGSQLRGSQLCWGPTQRVVFHSPHPQSQSGPIRGRPALTLGSCHSTRTPCVARRHRRCQARW